MSKFNSRQIKINQEQAILVAEKLGHKLHKFEKRKDYISSFCARCSAYVLVTSSEFYGGGVEDICQQLCNNCRNPLTNDDLDEKCIECRGDKLILYPKTPYIRKKDASFIVNCRKGNPDYEPSEEATSDFYWRCQSCLRRLGSGYQGEPDDRGYCQSCIDSEITYANRKADSIEAAGGLKIWKRKQLVNKILTPIDYVALIIGFLSFAALAMLTAISIVTAFYHLLKDFYEKWTNSSENKIISFVVVIAITWCIVRWKHLNKRPSWWDKGKE